MQTLLKLHTIGVVRVARGPQDCLEFVLNSSFTVQISPSKSKQFQQNNPYHVVKFLNFFQDTHALIENLLLRSINGGIEFPLEKQCAQNKWFLH